MKKTRPVEANNNSWGVSWEQNQKANRVINGGAEFLHVISIMMYSVVDLRTRTGPESSLWAFLREH